MSTIEASGSRVALRRTVLGVAIAAALLGVVLAITGGGALDLGFGVVSARRPWRALLAAVLATAALRLVAPWGLSATDLTALARRLERSAPAAAVAVALATLAVGLAWGTRAAGGSDSYCYIGQAEQFAAGRALLVEPLATQVPWRDPALSFAPVGHIPAPATPGAAAPMCPPGLALAMALAWKLAGPAAVHAVVPLLGALAVWLTYLLGRRLDGPLTGAVAAVLLATSPVFLYQIVQPMSDVPAVAWWLAAVVLVQRGTPWSEMGAGLAASAGLLTRPNLAPLLIPFWVFIWTRRRATRLRVTGGRGGVGALLRFTVALGPGVLLLAWLNSVRYGSPLGSGYGDLGSLFSLAHIGPNLGRYLRWLVETQTPFVGLALFAPILFARRERQGGDAAGPGRLTPAVWLCGGVSLVVFACYLPYVVFEDWWYLRFLLPALPPLLVLSTAVGMEAIRRLPAAARAPAVLIGCAALAAWYVDAARARHAFELIDLERRYIDAGRWVGRALPPEAVVVTVQESGSVRHYGRRPALMWDALEPTGLDDALAFLKAHGRPPYILVEDWEEPIFRRRFAGQQAGGLDWPPRARLDARVRVRVYDPGDRDRFLAGERIATDRMR